MVGKFIGQLILATGMLNEVQHADSALRLVQYPDIALWLGKCADTAESAQNYCACAHTELLIKHASRNMDI